MHTIRTEHEIKKRLHKVNLKIRSCKNRIDSTKKESTELRIRKEMKEWEDERDALLSELGE